jgi:hypothetical protein
MSTMAVVGFLWSALALLFYIIPNTRVRLFPAVLAATISTAAIYLLSRVLVAFPSLILSRNNFIYGSLAIFPAVLLMIYLFWMVVLYGAAVGFIYQRLYHSREKTSLVPGDSLAFRRMETDVFRVLKAAHRISGSPRAQGRRIVPLAVLADELGERPDSVARLAEPLIELGLLSRRAVRSGPVFAPRKPLAEVDLTGVHNLLLRIDPKGTGNLRSLDSWDEIKHTLGVLYTSGKGHPPLYMGTIVSAGSAPRV